VFTSPNGNVLRVSTYRKRVFRPAVVRLRDPERQACVTGDRQGDRGDSSAHTESTRQFPYISPHDRRHTAVSLAISAGANVKAVQTMLGHKSAAMTLDTYAHLFPDDLEGVAEALDAAARSAIAAAADELRTGTDDQDSKYS